ncbi:MAG: NUDIX domain-containing protein [Myxococcota bacterium]|jgi:8-oxo-dGTP pyrophosphatase MutT (NUDIX family)
MAEPIETSAGGVVYRFVDQDADRRCIEVAIARQRDRITRAMTVRLPKGHLEPGETAEQAAVREVREELGLCSRVVGTLGTTRYVYESGSGPVPKQVHLFLMEWVPSESLPLDGEMERVDWYSLDEAEQRLTFETEQRAIGWARAELVELAKPRGEIDG